MSTAGDKDRHLREQPTLSRETLSFDPIPSGSMRSCENSAAPAVSEAKSPTFLQKLGGVMQDKVEAKAPLTPTEKFKEQHPTMPSKKPGENTSKRPVWEVGKLLETAVLKASLKASAVSASHS